MKYVRFGQCFFRLAVFSLMAVSSVKADKEPEQLSEPNILEEGTLESSGEKKITEKQGAAKESDPKKPDSDSNKVARSTDSGSSNDVDLGMDNMDESLQDDSEDDQDRSNKRKSYAFFGMGIGGGGNEFDPSGISTDNNAAETLKVPTGYSNSGKTLTNPNAGDNGMPFSLVSQEVDGSGSFLLPIRFGYRAYMGNGPFFAGFQAGVMWCNFNMGLPLKVDYVTYTLSPPTTTATTEAKLENQKNNSTPIEGEVHLRFNMDTRFVLGATMGDRLSFYGAIGWSGNRIGTTTSNYAALPGQEIFSNPQEENKITANKFASGAVGAIGVDYAIGSLLVGVEAFSIFGISKNIQLYQYNNTNPNTDGVLPPYTDSCEGNANMTIWGVLLTISFKFEDL